MYLLLLAVLLTPVLAWAEGNVVTDESPITWKASATPNLVEHRLYVSATRGGYTKGKYVAAFPIPTTQALVRDLQLPKDGQYYAVVTAVGPNGAESPFSNESPFVRDLSIPLAPTGLTVGP